MSNLELTSRAWRKLAALIKARDNYRCQIRGPRCTGLATTVDHIVERDAGGTDDPSNLRAACNPCNSSRGASYGNAKRKPARRPGW